jgi:hypothetical protein
MAKSKPFSLSDLAGKGFIDDGTGIFKKERIFQETVLPEPSANKNLTKLSKQKKEKKPSEEVYFKNMTLTDVLEKSELDGFIFIPGNVPSLKNGKQLFKNKKTGKNFVTSSDLCKKYVEDSKIHWLMYRSRFKEMIKDKPYPLTIRLIFIRDQQKAFDYGNIAQIVWDCISGNIYFKRTKNKELNKLITKRRLEFSWIDDDDADHLIPDFSEGYGYDPKLPGVIIKVL